MEPDIQLDDRIECDEIVDLYRANDWSAATKPKELLNALRDSHGLVTARVQGRLIGLGNAISDGHMVVYYPHLLVHPNYQGKGVGRKMMRALLSRYSGFHQHLLIADGQATHFYEKMGFVRAGRTEPMWIYSGDDH